MTDNYISIVTLVSQHFGSFYPALPNTCEALLVAMHIMFTHSKDLPEDIFKAGAQFVFRLLSCRHFFSLHYQTLARSLLQCTPYLHIARTCLRTSSKQLRSWSSDSSLVVTSLVSQHFGSSILRYQTLARPCCNAHHIYT